MALSQVEVFNLALTRLGQDRAVSPSDEAEQVKTLAAIWDFTRDAVFAAHPWKFAIKRTTLPALADVPVGTTWARQFALPAECLRLVQVGEEWTFYGTEYETFALEGGNILTSEAAPLFVRYVQSITNVGLWPVLFGRVVALTLALDACEKLTTSNAKQESIRTDLAVALQQAKRQSAIERPPQRVTTSDWLAARGDD